MKLKQLFLLSCLVFMAGKVYSQNLRMVHGNMFDGYAYSVKTGKVSPSELFVIENDVIHLRGDNPGYLMSNKMYGNFKLTLEFRWVVDKKKSIDSKKRNSGLMYYVPECQMDTLWPKGIQFQIKEDATGDFILLQNITLNVNDSTYGPGRSVVVKHFKNVENPVGKWNMIEVIARGENIEQYLNHVLVNKGENASETKGRILFQFEGADIDFRKIKITSL